eukprot:775946-Rhodomonas_salina.2
MTTVTTTRIDEAESGARGEASELRGSVGRQVMTMLKDKAVEYKDASVLPRRLPPTRGPGVPAMRCPVLA